MSKATPKKKVAKKAAKPAKKREAKNKGLVLVKSPVRADVSFYVASDLADDKQIEAEILGVAAQEYVYEFETGYGENKKTVHGLSKNGVQEVTRLINRNPASGHKIRISPEPPIITRDVTYDGTKGIECMVYAEDLQSGGGNWGNAFEPYQKIGKQGKPYKNEFAERKALSKAQRNAMRGLIPEKVAIQMIAKLAKDKSNVARIELPAEAGARAIEAVPMNETERMHQLLGRVQQIAGNKKQLEQALKTVDTLDLVVENREVVRNAIQAALKELK